jgi:septal ring factor EnvC (AmiA/AmiB activator)
LRRDRNRHAQLQGELSRAEQQLLRRVARLEKRVRAAGGFARQRGRLPRPVVGPRVSAFGRAVDPQTGLSVARSGISFRPARRAVVRAVHRGVVRVARAVPGYGKLVVIEHADGYHSVYGFLARLRVEEGAEVWRGSAVGLAGVDPLNAQPATYFELRHEGDALDPVAWLRR